MSQPEKTEEYRKSIEAALESSLPQDPEIPEQILQAMRYSLTSGGKRLRPLLLLAAAEAVGGNVERVLSAAVAIEFIHTYSLIHDDLPAMDDDDLRRGHPTSHKVFGEAIAILAGDALLTHAFVLLAQVTNDKNPFPADRTVKVIREIAEAAGVNGMIGGQVIDLQSEGKKIPLEVLERMHRKKTGALIRAAVRVGAILGGAKAKELQALTEYAEHLGLAFQITDDILDEIGEESKMGKPVGSDQKNQKATFVTQWGLDYSRQQADKHSELAQAQLAIFGEKAQVLRQLAQYVNHRQG